MTLTELKTYLRERGVTCQREWLLKPALLDIATPVEKMMLPIDANFESEKSSQDNHELKIRDPFASSYNLVNGCPNGMLTTMLAKWKLGLANKWLMLTIYGV